MYELLSFGKQTRSLPKDSMDSWKGLNDGPQIDAFAGPLLLLLHVSTGQVGYVNEGTDKLESTACLHLDYQVSIYWSSTTETA